MQHAAPLARRKASERGPGELAPATILGRRFGLLNAGRIEGEQLHVIAMGATEKKEMQQAIGTGTWPGRFEPDVILDYCEADVDALARLLSAMLPRTDLPRALLRGRYMAAAALMEHYGVPIDVGMLARLRHGWTAIQDQLIADIDRDYGVYDGRTFKLERFAHWLAAEGIPWPRLESGQLDLSDSTFRQMARAYPTLARLLSAMLPRIDLPRALLRGRYMAAAALMKHYGVPIDVGMLARLRHGWTALGPRGDPRNAFALANDGVAAGERWLESGRCWAKLQ